MPRSASFSLVPMLLLLPMLAAGLLAHGQLESQPPVLALLPQNDEVQGWRVGENTLAFCPTPDALADIYDGGFERYVVAGVQEAAVQVYEADGELLLLYLHEMASPEQARAICDEERASFEQASAQLTDLYPAGNDQFAGGFLYPGGGQTSAHFWRGPIYCNVVVLGEEERHQRVAKQLAELMDRKIATLLAGGEEGAGER